MPRKAYIFLSLSLSLSLFQTHTNNISNDKLEGKFRLFLCISFSLLEAREIFNIFSVMKNICVRKIFDVQCSPSIMA
jgi:hypothetical protein